MKEKVRKPFIYATVFAVILGVIGIYLIAGDLSGRVILHPQVTNPVIYSTQDVSKHSNVMDCWIITDSFVYDITPAINSYSEFSSLKDKCGMNLYSVSLSDVAKGVLEDYKIGKLK